MYVLFRSPVPEVVKHCVVLLSVAGYQAAVQCEGDGGRQPDLVIQTPLVVSAVVPVVAESGSEGWG